jgi:hypothetical protein
MSNRYLIRRLVWSGLAAAAVIAAITANVRSGSPALPGIVWRGRAAVRQDRVSERSHEVTLGISPAASVQSHSTKEVRQR